MTPSGRGPVSPDEGIGDLHDFTLSRVSDTRVTSRQGPPQSPRTTSTTLVVLTPEVARKLGFGRVNRTDSTSLGPLKKVRGIT